MFIPSPSNSEDLSAPKITKDKLANKKQTLSLKIMI